MTNDATGGYYLYEFPLGNGFPDYPKWGRWTNTWAQTMNNFVPSGSGFVGPEVCLYERAKLLTGNPARQVCFQLAADGDSLLPADIDSPSNPPSNECQFFTGSLGNVSNTKLSLYSACIDWTRPSLAYVTGNHNTQLLTVPLYNGSCNGGFGGDCVPQKGLSDELDSLGDRLMYRFAYYNDSVGGKQHWYVNHDVQASPPQLPIGVRWYELQAPQIAISPLGMTLFQSGTYAPADSNYRWMGSIAGDRSNDILVGYSASSSSLYPSIAVAGRIKNDPLGLGKLESEISVVAGSASQMDTGNRWGDYSAMRLDPDGCTFWYTTEYYQVPQVFDWSTQIASLKFAGCHNPAYDGYIELCKATDPDYPVTGTFNFTLTAPFFSLGPIAVPVGTCSPPEVVPSGILTVSEAPQIGAGVENVTAISNGPFGQVNELDSWTFPDQSATVTVQPGGVQLETIATFTNYAAPPGTLKVCKIAGPGVQVGRLFTFTATGLPPFQVPAGPPPGGSCQIVGSFPVNSPVTITEMIPAGVFVSSITVEPPNRGGPPNLQGGSIQITIGNGVTEVDFTDASTQACGGQSLIIIDSSQQLAFAPIYTLDANQNAQIEVVDLPTLTFKTLISLPGAMRPISATYNPNSLPHPTMLVEAVLKNQSNGPIGVYTVDTISPYPVTGPLTATGLTYTTNRWGGILEDSAARNRAFVAGDYTIGILDQSLNTFGNVITLLNGGNTDSLSLNLVTDIIFIGGDGNNQIIQAATAPPLVSEAFFSPGFFGTTDGNAWDPFTNILLLSPEFVDQSWGFNFNTLNTAGGTAIADYIQVPGVCPGGGSGCACAVAPTGEGPGGQTAINCTTHQGVVADEFGQNFKVIQLPTSSVPGALDNNGRPFSGTIPDAASLYTIAEAVIPKGLVNGVPTQLGVVGDPNSLVVDNIHNAAYMLADACPGYHNWGSCGGITPPKLFLVKVDLTIPANSVGACPSGITGVSWTPASTAFSLK